MKRVILLVMDSLGIGSAPDAARFKGDGFTDEGANTLGHIADTLALAGTPLQLPNLARLGLLHAFHAKCGSPPAGMIPPEEVAGSWAFAREISPGKDTPSGHWEIAGVPVPFDWSYFPKERPCFPAELLARIAERSRVEGSLGNCHSSGTEIISRLGGEHFTTGRPICYTSADSVFQIAAHEEHFGLERLLDLCRCVRSLLDESDLMIGRVIARPFLGSGPEDFKRTGNRHDFAIPPPAPTVLQKVCAAGGSVIGVGKIGDIYAHTGITEEIRASGHPALWQNTLSALQRTGDRSLVMTNFVDFDALYGHRRDVAGYGQALQEFDAALPALLGALEPDDLLIITADHGNDPTWPGTDHTREDVPVLLHGNAVPAGADRGARETFADIGQTIADYFSLPAMESGTSLLG
jgi:phosphopentomutase